jgi:hypothetical protein
MYTYFHELSHLLYLLSGFICTYMYGIQYICSIIALSCVCHKETKWYKILFISEMCLKVILSIGAVKVGLNGQNYSALPTNSATSVWKRRSYYLKIAQNGPSNRIYFFGVYKHFEEINSFDTCTFGKLAFPSI